MLSRYAKRLLDDSSFYGGSLHVCYAPEYETVAECRLKLYECRHLNARISRKVEHEYLQKFSTNCQTSVPDPSILPSPSVASTSVKSDLSESIKLEISTNQDINVLPVSQENSMHSNESVAYQSYDALDDSRLYWRKLGITLFDKHQTACNFSASCSTTATTTTNYPSISTPCDLSVAPKRSVPLSVQQALSCRPYLENISKPNTSLLVSKVPSDNNKTMKHYSSNSLIPRVIISKEYRKRHSTNPEALSQVSKSTNPISVGELKRLAYSLGPKQGPSLPPTQDQRGNIIDQTRIVFHRSNSKRHCKHPSESEDN
uniref:RNA-binding protein 48 n=1 Tax=Schistosoma mansoni TaxID=6183 RepID=A0A5K4ET23_SCHMA